MSKETEAGDPGFEERLTAAFEKAVAKSQPVTQQQPSEEQIRAMLGYWRPDSAFLQQLFGEGAGEQHQNAFNALMERIEEMVDRRAQVIAQGTLGDFHGSIQPYLNDARELSEERFRSSLFSGEGERFKPYEKVLDKLLPQFKGEKDFPQSRAEQVTHLHKKFGELVGSAGGSLQTPAPRTASPLPALGGGSGGSGGKAGGAVDLATASQPLSLAAVMNGGQPPQ